MSNASRKVDWNRSMDAKLNYERQLEQAAIKVAEGQKVTLSLPKDKGGCHKPKNLLMFQGLVEKAKIDKAKRREQRQKEEKAAPTT